MNPDKEKSKKKSIKIGRAKKESSDKLDEQESLPDTEELKVDIVDDKVSESTEEKKELTPEETIAHLADKVEKLNDNLLRERASIINYRKRMDEEKGMIRRYGASDLAFDLLQVLDYFEESLKFESSGNDLAAILQGVKFTVDEMHKILAKHGIKEIATDTSFNPKLHEAFGTVETDDQKPGEILKVHRKGYMFKDRVLRAAMVTVSKIPEKQSNDKNDEVVKSNGDPETDADE